MKDTHTSFSSAGVPVLYAFISRSLGSFGCFQSWQTLSDCLPSGLTAASKFWSGIWPGLMGFGLHLSLLVGWNGFDCHSETVKKPLLMQEIHAARSGSFTKALQDFWVNSMLSFSFSRWNFKENTHLFKRNWYCWAFACLIMKLSRCFSQWDGHMTILKHG